MPPRKLFVNICIGVFFIFATTIGRYERILRSFVRGYRDNKALLELYQPPSNISDSDYPTIWIHVGGFGEGMSKWRHSVPQLLGFARLINATLVEPCMHDGRLYSCKNFPNVTLSSVFSDAEQYKTSTASSRSALMATYDEFMKLSQSNTTELKFCLHKGSCGNTENYFMKPIPFLHNISKYALGSGNLVLNIPYFWINAFEVNEVETIKPETSLIEFHQRHHKKVDEILHRANITNDEFAIIHWRGEVKNMDYRACARKIIQGKSKMIQNGGDITSFPFMLMSSINEDTSTMWGGAKIMAENSNSSVKEALQTLHQAGFLKLDYLMTENEKQSLEDFGILAVYELILAARSRRFATCTRRDCRGDVCQKCNYPGGFSEYAVDYRQLQGSKSSDTCWP
ncbi:hypothetical protein CTEN210_16074 [Chaetoceros tenuissimus]|uniref:Uncharacterized protein n=1 Tax=Chaetoceros tenuissimus TaxID=426638 RepID=A0AAD3HE16_9STRA|nr:hypothetical protein CTEN210_16074 [Chaetoceros tenuissimus]